MFLATSYYQFLQSDVRYLLSFPTPIFYFVVQFHIVSFEGLCKEFLLVGKFPKECHKKEDLLLPRPADTFVERRQHTFLGSQ